MLRAFGPGMVFRAMNAVAKVDVETQIPFGNDKQKQQQQQQQRQMQVSPLRRCAPSVEMTRGAVRIAPWEMTNKSNRQRQKQKQQQQQQQRQMQVSPLRRCAPSVEMTH